MSNKLHIWLSKSASKKVLRNLIEQPDANYDFWLEKQFNIDNFLDELCGMTFLGNFPSIEKIVGQIPYEYLSERITEDIRNSDIDLQQVNSLISLVSTERDNLFQLNELNVLNDQINLWYLNSYDLFN